MRCAGAPVVTVALETVEREPLIEAAPVSCPGSARWDVELPEAGMAVELDSLREVGAYLIAVAPAA